MTELQEALSEGVAEVSGKQGTWSFNNESFPGSASALKASDSRMKGSTDRHFELVVTTSLLPTVPPKRGNEIICEGVIHRIARADGDPLTGQTVFIIARA